MRKTIGNILLIVGLASFFIFMLGIVLDWDIEHGVFAVIYAVGVLGGGALRIGDFFKWRAKKHAEGIAEAMAQHTRFCPHCGKGLTADTAFCPHCGKALK